MVIAYSISITRFPNNEIETFTGICDKKELDKVMSEKIIEILTDVEKNGIEIDILRDQDCQSIKEILDFYVDYNDHYMETPPVIINYFDTKTNEWNNYELNYDLVREEIQKGRVPEKEEILDEPMGKSIEIPNKKSLQQMMNTMQSLQSQIDSLGKLVEKVKSDI